MKKLAGLVLVGVLSSGCAQAMLPKDPGLSLIRIDSGSDPDGWSLSVSDRRVDGEKVSMFGSDSEFRPGHHDISVDWNLTSDGEDKFVGFDLLASKSGSCHTTLITQAGRGYFANVYVRTTGDWFTEPRVVLGVSESSNPWTIIHEAPCDYLGRGVVPGWVNNH